MELAFCTLGMFIIDEIEYINGKGSEHSIIGGAGTYAAIGARLAAGNRNAHRVSWIVDIGSDFPPDFRSLIDTWNTSCVFRTDLNRLTTRAWNGYGPNEYRAFRYLTPKLRLEEHSLSDAQSLAKSFHMVCSPARCMTLVRDITSRREMLQKDCMRPIIVWEPVPDLCTPEELDNLRQAISFVDVISPNGDELASFFASTTQSFDRESMVLELLDKSKSKSSTAVVVRDGADGSRLYFGTVRLHVRAYHQDGVGVVDPTGGGNTYLGALTIGLTGDIEAGLSAFKQEEMLGSRLGVPDHAQLASFVVAIIHATIAASFAIEQTGMPILSRNTTDVWNGVAYRHRLVEYVAKERTYLLDQLKKFIT